MVTCRGQLIEYDRKQREAVVSLTRSNLPVSSLSLSTAGALPRRGEVGGADRTTTDVKGLVRLHVSRCPIGSACCLVCLTGIVIRVPPSPLYLLSFCFFLHPAGILKVADMLKAVEGDMMNFSIFWAGAVTPSQSSDYASLLYHASF